MVTERSLARAAHPRLFSKDPSSSYTLCFLSFLFLDPVSIKRCVGQVYLGVSGLTRSGRKKKSQKKQKITKHKKSFVFQVCCPASLPSASLTRALVLFVRSFDSVSLHFFQKGTLAGFQSGVALTHFGRNKNQVSCFSSPRSWPLISFFSFSTMSFRAPVPPGTLSDASLTQRILRVPSRKHQKHPKKSENLQKLMG